METVKKIESNINDLKFGYIDDNDQFIEIGHDNIEEAAKKFGCSEDLLDLMWCSFEAIKEAVHDDLKDIWKKI